MANDVVTQQRQPPEIVKFREELEQRGNELKMALPQHITPERFQRTIVTTVMSDPELLKADRRSLLLACMKAAQDGLLPDKREAAIVVFKESKKQADGGWQTKLIAQYMPMVYGLRKKILQSNEVSSLEVGVVYRAEVEAGKFLYEVGLEPPLRHRPMLELTEEQTRDSEIVAAYSIATMKDGTKSFEVMRRFEIDKVREVSKTGATRDRKGQPRNPSGPWVDWFPEQAKKTVMRRHSKVLPQSGDIVIDVEAQDDNAAASAAALLHSREPDAPLIEHRDDEPPAHDSETGELTDDSQGSTDNSGQATNEGQQSSEGQPEAESEKPKRTRRTKEQIAADAEKERELERENVAQGQQGNDQQEPLSEQQGEGDAGSTSEASGEAQEPERDEQTGMSRHPAEGKADELIASMKAASTIIDLDRIFNDSEGDREAMPDEVAAAVYGAYRRETKRLKGGA